MGSLSKLKMLDGEEREFILRGGNPLVAWPLARRRTAEQIRLRRAVMRDTIAKIKSEAPEWEPGESMMKWLRDHYREPLHSGTNRPKPTRENV